MGGGSEKLVRGGVPGGAVLGDAEAGEIVEVEGRGGGRLSGGSEGRRPQQGCRWRRLGIL